MNYPHGINFMNICFVGANSFNEMRNLLLNKNETIGGALLEAYVAGYHKDELDYDHGFRIASVVEHFVAYGIVLSPARHDRDNTTTTTTTTSTSGGQSNKIPTLSSKESAADKRLKQCLLQFTSLHQSTINEIVQQNSNPLEV